jgi:hypothetical protein
MRLVSDKHAQASPGALLVRQPCGGALEDDGAGVDGVTLGAGDGVGAGPDVIGLVPVVDGGAAGSLAVGGVVGCGVVCARAIGAASRPVATMTNKKRFIGELPRMRPRPAL